MTAPEAEALLIEYAAMMAARDALVTSAVAAGVSKHRVHVLTGIARTTIDAIFRASAAGED